MLAALRGLRPRLPQLKGSTVTTISLERLARNQVIFREVNERLREIADPADDFNEFACECSDPCCTERLELDNVQYAAVRSMPNVFMIVPGHERLESERVIDDDDRLMLVEKTTLVDDADLKAAFGSRPWPTHGL